ncbi:MAG: DUF5618 family protein [Planctomycetes bacterium]|nr:DUF5618 family protein [Planctomycetota bacterium]
MKEAIRYLHNAREILKKAPREGRFYTDVKPVREACSTAYLSILEAINEYLLNRGLSRKELPKSVEAYQKALHKYIGVHNGNLFKEFNMLYDELHIAGYYRGWLHEVAVIKEILDTARQFIGKISK